MPRLASVWPKSLVTALGVLVGVAALGVARAQQIDPTQVDRVTATIVAELIHRVHLSKPTLNDNLSEEWYRLFIRSLDPQKLFFEKSDIAEFDRSRKELDDQIRAGDLGFAKQVFERYLERRRERLVLINEILDQPIDFTVDETYIDEPDQLNYPADDAEVQDRWRKELKYQLLIKKVNDVEDTKALQQVRDRYRGVNRIFEKFDTSELLEIYLTALANAIDPHSNYMNWKTTEDMTQQQLQLSLEGIGATLGIDDADGIPVIKGLVQGGAAAKDGRLKVEDKILAVEKEDGTRVEFAEMKISDVVRFIRGPRDTKVRLVVQPNGTKETTVYELTREKIELADQRAKGEIIESTGPDGQPLKIGVIDLSSFYGDTAAVRRGDENAISATLDTKRLLADFKAKGVDAVVLDLRKNGGGLLLEAISLSGLFIDKGPVVRVRDGEGVLPYDDEDAGTAYDGPMAVLISRFSASASEIFAGVIKDYNRGLIIGDSSTFGKGTVQSVIELNRYILQQEDAPKLGALKLTIQQFYRANGMSTQVRGVTPDVRLPSIIDNLEDLSEGDQDNALEFDEIEPLPHDNYGRVPADLIAQLDSRSNDRRKESEKFQKQEQSIQKLLARQEKHRIPLQEAAFRAEFENEDKNAEEIKELQDENVPDAAKDEVWDKDSFYNQEVLSIVTDYITLGQEVLAAHPIPLPVDAARPN